MTEVHDNTPESTPTVAEDHAAAAVEHSEEVKHAEPEAASATQPDKTPSGSSLASLTALDRSGRPVGGATAQKDVSVATVVRLMGLPTSAELRIVEQKLDTLTTKLTAMGQKLDRVATAVQSSSDVDGIQVQLADVKRLVKELMTKFEK